MNTYSQFLSIIVTLRRAEIRSNYFKNANYLDNGSIKLYTSKILPDISYRMIVKKKTST